MGDPKVTMVASVPKWSSMTWMMTGVPHDFGNFHMSSVQNPFVIPFSVFRPAWSSHCGETQGRLQAGLSQ